MSEKKTIKSDIGNFAAYLNRYTDVARASRFKVYITPKHLSLAANAGVTEKLSFQCESAELPGRTLATFDARTYGPSIKYPYQTSYGDINLTFYCTGNPTGTTSQGLWEKRFFDAWMDKINRIPSRTPQNSSFGDPELFVYPPAWNMAYKDDYSSEIEIVHYDSDGDETYVVKLIDAFPIAVNQLSLSWAEESVLRLVVTFAYTRWETIGKAAVSLPKPVSAAPATGRRLGIVDSLTTAGSSAISGLKRLFS